MICAEKGKYGKPPPIQISGKTRTGRPWPYKRPEAEKHAPKKTASATNIHGCLYHALINCLIPESFPVTFTPQNANETGSSQYNAESNPQIQLCLIIMLTPLPPLLTTSEPGSFAAFTLEKRLPAILDNLAKNADALQTQILQQLASEIRGKTITPLPPLVFGSLDQTIKPYTGRRWADMPYLAVELYFYARILLAFGYAANTLIDPFRPAKQQANLQAIESLAALRDYCNEDCSIVHLLRWSVMGNIADLSQYAIPEADQVSLLMDESNTAEALLDSCPNQIDYVFDNAGMDVLADLLLIRRISRHCARIVAHVRPWPMFVSDMTMTDITHLIGELTASPIATVQTLGEDITRLLHQNQLVLRASPALGLPICFCEDETLVHKTFENSELVLFKGDLNYRYFAGDRRWPHTTEKQFFFERFGRSAVCLRMLKSEVLVGLPADIAAQTLQLPSGWLTSGRHGVIQVFIGRR